jgi:hypothetical protein
MDSLHQRQQVYMLDMKKKVSYIPKNKKSNISYLYRKRCDETDVRWLQKTRPAKG